LESEGCNKIYSEKFTGTKADRPQFLELLSLLKKGDTLVVTKLDRFARSAENGVNLIKELLSKGIKVHILNMGLVEDTSMGRLILRMLTAIAEFDRDMIVERLAEEKAIARQNPDFREGRPKKFTKKKIAHALQLLEINSYTQVEEITGISKSTLIRAKREVTKGLL
jgi:DNA invertase Pin-like site-specific DNA recombinase